MFVTDIITSSLPSLLLSKATGVEKLKSPRCFWKYWFPVNEYKKIEDKSRFSHLLIIKSFIPYIQSSKNTVLLSGAA